MKAAEDFLLLVLHAHVVVAAEEVDSLCPCESVEDLAKLVITNYVHFPVYEGEVPQQCGDQVYLYATELLSLSLLWHGFHDATCEGDGDRLLLYWKFFLVVFKSSSRWNYAKEAVNLLISRSLFSERKAHQLTWSRTVNTKGRIGCNIPCDLNQEHLIRRLKTMLKSMGIMNKKTIIKAGKCVLTVHKICQEFEKETTGKCAPSGRHSRPKFSKDLRSVITELEEIQVFSPISNRSHPTFNWKCSLFHVLPKKEMCKKIQTSIDQIIGTDSRLANDNND